MSSHLTGNLDRGVRRLLAMWPVVKKELETAFLMAEKPLEAEEASEEDSAEGQQQAAGTVGERVIDLDAFKVSSSWSNSIRKTLDVTLLTYSNRMYYLSVFTYIDYIAREMRHQVRRARSR